jgi:DNA mismatch endonuclease (patch repair protein)
MIGLMKKKPMTRSENMRRIKSKNTKIERLLGKAMWAEGLRYRKNCKDVFGKPDFCFKSKKIAIFCDSEFWHGKKFLEGEGFKTNSDFWETKIKRNIERDMEVNQKLENEGWKVIRLWGKEIEHDSVQCAEKIKNMMEIR